MSDNEVDDDILEAEGEKRVITHKKDLKGKDEIREMVMRTLVRVVNRFQNDQKERRPLNFGKYTWKSADDARVITTIYFIVNECHALLTNPTKKDDHFMFRELYYKLIQSVPQFLFEPEEIIFAVKVICDKYKWHRHYLPLETIKNGLIFVSKGAFMKTKSGDEKTRDFISIDGVAVVPGEQTISGWLDVELKASFILVLESHAQFNMLKKDGFYEETSHSITLIAQGFPSLAIRFLLHKLFSMGKTDNIPVFCFFDSDGWGVNLGSLLRFGAFDSRSIENNYHYTVPRLIPIYVTDDGVNAKYERQEKKHSDEVGLQIARHRLLLEHIKDDQVKAAAEAEVGEWKGIAEDMDKSHFVVPHSCMGNLKDFLKDHPNFKKGNFFVENFEHEDMELGSQSSSMSINTE